MFLRMYLASQAAVTLARAEVPVNSRHTQMDDTQKKSVATLSWIGLTSLRMARAKLSLLSQVCPRDSQIDRGAGTKEHHPRRVDRAQLKSETLRFGRLQRNASQRLLVRVASSAS